MNQNVSDFHYVKFNSNYIHLISTMVHMCKTSKILKTLVWYMIQKIIIFFMHRKLLPVCLEGKICCNSSANTIDTENTKTRSLNRAKYLFTFFVLMLVKRSEYSIIFSLFLVVVIMGVTMLSKNMKIDNTQKMQTLRFGIWIIHCYAINWFLFCFVVISG